jgi:GntR family transcriptional regulator / MocR family aminotransferase
MPKSSSALDLVLPDAPEGVSRSQWLYEEVRNAILFGRLRRGTRVPASRDLAGRYRVSRGIVVAAFEQLRAEGYLESKQGAGTFVSQRLPEDLLPRATPPARPSKAAVSSAPREQGSPRAFRLNEPAIDAFPVDIWAKLVNRRWSRASRALLASGDARGYRPLRDAIASYLGTSRGVRCEAEQVVVVSGTQQALDLLARLLFKPGAEVWMEDPGYAGAVAAFRNAGANLVAVPVDDRGLDVAAGERLAPNARAAYVTPAHQFPLGASMPIERRLALLDWARRANALVIEDDYDSEFRFEGRPLPALQGVDPGHSVAFLGSFNKALFPSLRLGYVVLPPQLIEPFAAMRFRVDRYSPQLDQAVLCDFIEGGHFARHLRRMRAVYESRLHALRESLSSELAGALRIPPIEAGLQTAAPLTRDVDMTTLLRMAGERGLEVHDLARWTLQRTDVRGLHLGFAAIDEQEIRRGAKELAACVAASLKP